MKTRQAALVPNKSMMTITDLTISAQNKALQDGAIFVGFLIGAIIWFVYRCATKKH